MDFTSLRQGETFTLDIKVLNDLGNPVSLNTGEKLIASLYDANNKRLLHSNTDSDITYDTSSHSYKWSIVHSDSTNFIGRVYIETTIVDSNDVIHCKNRDVIDFEPRLNNQLI